MRYHLRLGILTLDYDQEHKVENIKEKGWPVTEPAVAKVPGFGSAD
jgi:hypothetical protein